ncbi:DNA polymerase III subunit gamma/tau [Microbacterium album]|uniref:DNA polymerase III subunit gamma/tau n=1 Tax=Microbacterium album TaxID=2053191 RepID=A0A917IDZ3_9MICO|nr:DNA polymerase III subunit gamma/tau [Microbacterium album]GGH40002.1 hypothetical protein GCM10010921_11620 [Microbacterium album]
MSSGDDEALSWDGDDDPTLAAPGSRARRGRDREDRPGDTAEPADPPSPDQPVATDPAPSHEPAPSREPAPMGNAALVSFGVIGGVYALYVVGWVLGGLRLRDRIETATGAVADMMFQGALWLAVLAPVVWFGTTVYLTRGGPLWRRFAGLVAGIVVLVPWPFVMVGVIGR